MNKEIRDKFPYEGDILIFKGVPEFYYPMYLNMGKLARKELIVGNEYKIRKVEIYSSWCAVWLEGVGGEDDYFNLSFFTDF